jgi:uncharacterized pyridoxamine 5'-phosphate oxidase family protein
MPAQITTDQVWSEIEKRIFAVLGVVTAKGEARTAGIVYMVRGRELYIGTSKEAWKTRHIQQNPHVSLTVTIPKRIPFLPFLPIPPATITFQGQATVHQAEELEEDILKTLYKGMEINDAFVADSCVIRVKPRGDFVTYGVGVSLSTMRNPEKSRGRIGVA